MNTQQMYQRRVDRSTREHDASPLLAASTDDAVAGAPSTPGKPSHANSMTEQRRTVTWVRVSDLHAVLGSRVAGRGIDLQSELARRALHAPSKVRSRVSTLRHPPPPATPAVPTRLTDRTEGWSL